jgi:ribosomal protein S6
MVLLDNREVRQGWDAVKDSVTTMLTKHNAEVVSSKLWEERRLAYSIKNQQRGTYLLVYFNAPTGEIAPINREMNMAELVLRHMVTACDEVPESAGEPEQEFDVTKIGIEQTPKPAEAPAAEAEEASAEAGSEEAPATEEAPAAEAEGASAEAGSEEAPATEEAPAAEAATESSETPKEGEE